MTNHESRLRSLAKDLAEAYTQLDDIKTARAQPPKSASWPHDQGHKHPATG